MDGTGEHDLSEVNQAEKAKNHVLPHMWIIDPK
jgi:hypothetical protein